MGDRVTPDEPRLFGLPVQGAARAYFALQAIAGAAWWVAVPTIDVVRSATLGDLNPALVAAFDLPLFVLASALVAFGVRWALWVVTPWTVLVAALMALYATTTQLAGVGAVLMIAAAVCSVLAATVLIAGKIPGRLLLFGPFAFRVAKPAGKGAHLGRTIAQMLGFWGSLPPRCTRSHYLGRGSLAVATRPTELGVGKRARPARCGERARRLVGYLDGHPRGRHSTAVGNRLTARHLRPVSVRAKSNGSGRYRPSHRGRANARVVACGALRTRRFAAVELGGATARRVRPRGAIWRRV